MGASDIPDHFVPLVRRWRLAVGFRIQHVEESVARRDFDSPTRHHRPPLGTHSSPALLACHFPQLLDNDSLQLPVGGLDGPGQAYPGPVKRPASSLIPPAPTTTPTAPPSPIA